MFVLLLCGNAIPAIATPEHLREGKLFRPVSRSWGDGEHRPDFLEEVIRDERLVRALVPVIPTFQVLEHAVVEGVVQNYAYVIAAEENGDDGSCSKESGTVCY